MPMMQMLLLLMVLQTKDNGIYQKMLGDPQRVCLDRGGSVWPPDGPMWAYWACVALVGLVDLPGDWLVSMINDEWEHVKKVFLSMA